MLDDSVDPLCSVDMNKQATPFVTESPIVPTSNPSTSNPPLRHLTRSTQLPQYLAKGFVLQLSK